MNWLFNCLIVCSFSCYSQIINGLSVVGESQQITIEKVGEIKEIGASWVSLMPYSFIRSKKEPTLVFDSSWQWVGETSEGIKQSIALIQKQQIQVMLKPHLWINHGEFTGHLTFESQEQWEEFYRSYRAYILHYAKIAEEYQVAIFCLGTELEYPIKNNPLFWKNLILEIKGIYSGKLTYASNWDEYIKFPFWSELDYVGVDAYFPLNENKDWEYYKKQLNAFSNEVKKPILFTEMGYRSVDDPISEPWVSKKDNDSYNGKAQAIALENLYNACHGQSWWAGGFIWKWFPHSASKSKMIPHGFSPQGKPAEEILKKYFKKECL